MAPMEEMAAPTLRVFLRPRRSPAIAASKQPPRFPSCIYGELWFMARDGSATYREATCSNALDAGDLGLGKGIDEIGAYEDTGNDSLVIAIPCLSSRVSSSEGDLQGGSSQLASVAYHVRDCKEEEVESVVFTGT